MTERAGVFINGAGDKLEELSFGKSISEKVSKQCRSIMESVPEKSKPAYLAILITVITQAVVFSAWLGRQGERLDTYAMSIMEIKAEQAKRADIYYSVPFISKTVTETQNDVKELKRMFMDQERERKRGD